MRSALRALCCTAAALWIAALLASQALGGRSPFEPDPRARVQPLPEPPPEVARAAPEPAEEPEPQREPEPVPEPEPSPPDPAPDPEPDPEPEPAAEPEPVDAPTAVGRAEMEAGAELLAQGGSFPALSCSYDTFASFRAYARAMRSLGARFVAVRHREIVGEVDLESGAVRDAALSGSFSPRARDYSGEPGLADVAASVRSRFGAETTVMMLVPRALDAGLFGGIARELEDRGERHAAFREFRGRYEREPGGRLHVRFDTAVRRDGRAVAVNWLFDLSGIVRGRGGRA